MVSMRTGRLTESLWKMRLISWKRNLHLQCRVYMMEIISDYNRAINRRRDKESLCGILFSWQVSLQRIILIFKYSESIIIQTGKITEICKRTMKVNKTKKRDDAWNFVCNCYNHHPGDTNEEKTEIKMSEYRSECRMGNCEVAFRLHIMQQRMI